MTRFLINSVNRKYMVLVVKDETPMEEKQLLRKEDSS